jgi:hypothetical protein
MCASRLLRIPGRNTGDPAHPCFEVEPTARDVGHPPALTLVPKCEGPEGPRWESPRGYLWAGGALPSPPAVDDPLPTLLALPGPAVERIRANPASCLELNSVGFREEIEPKFTVQMRLRTSQNARQAVSQP